ncbi:cytochrome P450, putative [Talaromyces stipitatus ATCC 10500]|uniref:Cytochrome P450, putative n=1 Tax=Talaromyces stipitatus (strain ATCC 10500 / CBS 375.48 / QM 6759 / NRRL 1006) TaxID=441959 RepID=B8LTZ0_TALSN|nr:cytochrome P450, putative [Talaromyces stipitatus ATCC 10500]EED23820.1 cytochrome P450, putative [Talaromyces stipitatus ATCC 10500]
MALYALFNKKMRSKTISLLCYPFDFLKRRGKAWLFLFKGPSIIQEGYDKTKGAPFEILAPDARYLFVSSAEHIKAIDAAPDSVLSLQAAAKQMLQPKYTMHNFNWFDQRGLEGTPLVRALRTLLTNHVPDILPDIRRAMVTKFDQMLQSCPEIDGGHLAPLYSMIISVVAYSNALAFFGEELAQNQEFMKSAVDFIEKTLLVAEIMRLLPCFMAPKIGTFLANKFKAHLVINDNLVAVTEERLRERDMKRFGHEIRTHKDCIQWVMECSPKQKPWSAQRIVHELMALWFGSVHVLSTTICFAIHDLCLHPEYIEPLRAECAEPGAMDLLDSFIKESMRTTPVESMSTRRQALQPFELPDGHKIQVGDWICTPLRAMMRDSANYPDPLKFDGFRFVDTERLNALKNMPSSLGSDPEMRMVGSGKGSRLTDVIDWQVWGTGRMACPGRYYAAAIMRTVVEIFITEYDIQLSNPEASRWVSWRTFIYPRSSTEVVLRRRI